MSIALRKGCYILKHGRSGRPKVHFFRLSADGTALRWRSSRSGSVRSVALRDVQTILVGQSSDLFQRYPLHASALSLSLRYRASDGSQQSNGDNGGPWRSLDISFADAKTFNIWYHGLRLAVQGQRDASTKPSPSQGAMHAPLGDVLIWGRAVVPEPTPSSRSDADAQRHDSEVFQTLETTMSRGQLIAPSPMLGNQLVNAANVAVAPRHVIVVSMDGTAFVQGEGKNGQLGCGHTNDLSLAKINMAGIPSSISKAACGDGYSAFVTDRGELFMAGKVPGREHTLLLLPTAIQVRRSPTMPLRVTHVSCGLFHWAVIADGSLWTAGDGWGGKLGLGDQESREHPCLVTALPDAPVISVACGVWHTACIVEEALDPYDDLTSSASEPKLDGASPPSPLHRFHHRRGSSTASFGSAIEAAAKKVFVVGSTEPPSTGAMAPGTESLHPEYHEGKGGALYTWGGINNGASPQPNGAGSSKALSRDGNKGCLGHGECDVHTGQLLPKKVSGALESRLVRCVSAGLNLTVACTTNGLVYQMGSTGAAPCKVPTPWEGATTPTLVQGALVGQFVDDVACGMHHVATLARPLDRKTSKPTIAAEGGGGSNACPGVFVWGRGDQGQLGTGKLDDSATPVPVDGMRGHHALSIACAGATTAVVIRHDDDRWESTGGKEEGEKICKALNSLMKRPTGAGNIRLGSLSSGFSVRPSFRNFPFASSSLSSLGSRSRHPSNRSSALSHLSRTSTTSSSQMSGLTTGAETMSQRSGTAGIISLSATSSPTASLRSLSMHLSTTQPSRSHAVSDPLEDIRRISPGASGGIPYQSMLRTNSNHVFMHGPSNVDDEDAISHASFASSVRIDASIGGVGVDKHRGGQQHSSHLEAMMLHSSMYRRERSCRTSTEIDPRLQTQVHDIASSFRDGFWSDVGKVQAVAAPRDHRKNGTEKGLSSPSRNNCELVSSDMIARQRASVSREIALDAMKHEEVTTDPSSSACALAIVNTANDRQPEPDQVSAEGENGREKEDGLACHQSLEEVLIERKQELSHQKHTLASWADQLRTSPYHIESLNDGSNLEEINNQEPLEHGTRIKKSFDNGVEVVAEVSESRDSMVSYRIRFPKELFTLKQAIEWYAQNKQDVWNCLRDTSTEQSPMEVPPLLYDTADSARWKGHVGEVSMRTPSDDSAPRYEDGKYYYCLSLEELNNFVQGRTMNEDDSNPPLQNSCDDSEWFSPGTRIERYVRDRRDAFVESRTSTLRVDICDDTESIPSAYQTPSPSPEKIANVHVSDSVEDPRLSAVTDLGEAFQQEVSHAVSGFVKDINMKTAGATKWTMYRYIPSARHPTSTPRSFLPDLECDGVSDWNSDEDEMLPADSLAEELDNSKDDGLELSSPSEDSRTGPNGVGGAVVNFITRLLHGARWVS